MPFDPRLISTVPAAVAKAAMDSGVARRPILDMDEYRAELSARLDPVSASLHLLFERVQSNPKRIVFAEGEQPQIARAANAFHNAGLGRPILIGRHAPIREAFATAGIGLSDVIEMHDTSLAERRHEYAEFLFRRLQRKGYLLRDCQRLVNNDRNVFGACMVAMGHADGMVTGVTRNWYTAYEDVRKVLDARPRRRVIAVSIALIRGRAVLVAEDCFPSNHFLLAGLAERLGFTLRTVPLRQGAAWVEDEDVIAGWTPDVGLALLTWVSSVSSHRCDLGALVAHGRRMGSLIGVDITQAAGLLAFDVKAPAIDFAVSTSLKWTCGAPGAGMLYVAPALIPQCQPRLRGWFSQPDPFSWDITRFSYAPDIRRFDHGTPGVMACAATVPALDWHAGQDHEAMRAHNRNLCAQLQAGVLAAGLSLASPTDPEARGGSIMVRLDDAAAVAATLARLAAAHVQADGRGRVLRLSPGVLTGPEGIARALDVLRKKGR